MRPSNQRKKQKMNEDDKTFSKESVRAFLSAIASSLGTLGKEASTGDRRRLNRLVEAGIAEFFLDDPELQNLSEDERTDLQEIHKMFLDQQGLTDFVMFEPDDPIEH